MGSQRLLADPGESQQIVMNPFENLLMPSVFWQVLVFYFGNCSAFHFARAGTNQNSTEVVVSVALV